MLGFSTATLEALTTAVSNPGGPTVLWVQGASCSGCSVSFLNYVSDDPNLPPDAADILINVINLAYHPTLMTGAGETAVDALTAAFQAGGYVLVVEGGVPTAFGGNTCWTWSEGGQHVTFLQAVQMLAGRAAAIICAGTCSAFGGIPAAPPNPTGIQTVSQATGLPTINVPGCPPHPDWLVYVIAEYLAGNTIPLDVHGRPTALFYRTVHQDCPRRHSQEADHWGQFNRCKEDLGCRGEDTVGPCVFQYFNEGANWCIGAGSNCIGCTEPDFPTSDPLFVHD